MSERTCSAVRAQMRNTGLARTSPRSPGRFPLGATMLGLVAVLCAIRGLATETSLDGALAGEVVVQNVSLRDEAVSGTVVNRSPRSVREVRLQITYAWMWNDERHPGSNAPGRTEYYTLAAEIPTGGSAPFTYRPTTPLPTRSDGRFVPSVSVVGVTEVLPPNDGGDTVEP